MRGLIMKRKRPNTRVLLLKTYPWDRKGHGADFFPELVYYRKLVTSSQAASKEEETASWECPGRGSPDKVPEDGGVREHRRWFQV